MEAYWSYPSASRVRTESLVFVSLFAGFPLTFLQPYKSICFHVNSTIKTCPELVYFFCCSSCGLEWWLSCTRKMQGRGVSCSRKWVYHDAPARSLIGSMISNLLSVARQGALRWACDMPFLRGFQLLLCYREGLMTLLRDLNTVLLKNRRAGVAGLMGVAGVCMCTPYIIMHVSYIRKIER